MWEARVDHWVTGLCFSEYTFAGAVLQIIATVEQEESGTQEDGTPHRSQRSRRSGTCRAERIHDYTVYAARF